MNIKYQIFVSSTYEDLKDERNEVIKASLNMGHIPVGMEMFNAADEEQWAVITRTIDQCDYYVVIVAYRYGSTVDGVSFTEKEYDYAIAQGVPVLGFIIAEKDVTWPPEWIEREPEAVKALQQFKEKVKKKMIRDWQNHSELRAMFVESLATAINVAPRRGWIRAPAEAGSDIAQTLSNLAEENARLRKMINDSSHVSAEEIADVASILHKMMMPPNVKGKLDTTFAYAYQHYIASELLHSSRIDLDGIAKELEVDPNNVEVMMQDLEFFKVIQVLNDGGYALTELGRRVLLRLAAAHPD